MCVFCPAEQPSTASPFPALREDGVKHYLRTAAVGGTYTASKKQKKKARGRGSQPVGRLETGQGCECKVSNHFLLEGCSTCLVSRRGYLTLYSLAPHLRKAGAKDVFNYE